MEVNREMLWLKNGDSSGTQRKATSAVESSYHGTCEDSRLKKLSACHNEL
jgi:hypothetical protein